MSFYKISLFLVFVVFLYCNENSFTAFKDGDIIFQTSKSSQSKALQIATKSKFSHMGIIYFKDDKPYVYEAVQPVKLTPLDEWIARGENNKFAVKRLKEAEKLLTPENLKKLKEAGQKYLNKNYDLYFEWSDERIYCSELVWKMYDEALGVQIGTLQTLKNFDLSHPIVKAKLNERYGAIIPLNEDVIAPVAMYNSGLLELVYSNF